MLKMLTKLTKETVQILHVAINLSKLDSSGVSCDVSTRFSLARKESETGRPPGHIQL